MFYDLMDTKNHPRQKHKFLCVTSSWMALEYLLAKNKGHIERSLHFNHSQHHK